MTNYYKELIAIIVPVYKTEKYLSRCISSILGQSYRNYTLVLINDGSPDNCGTICDEYAKNNKRIHVIHQDNQGLSAARNAGLDWIYSNIEFDWITFIDSDDWVDENYLAYLLNTAKEFDVSISACSFDKVSNKDDVHRITEIRAERIKVEDYYINNSINATISCAKLYSKDCFNNIRFPFGKLHEDEFITYLLLFRYDGIGFINAPLYHYYTNTESITQSPWSPRRLDGIEAVKEQVEFFLRNNKKVFCVRKEVYFSCLYNMLIQIDKSNTEFKSLYKRVKRELRRSLLKYRAFPIKKYFYYYEAAYTILEYIKKIKSKIKFLAY